MRRSSWFLVALAACARPSPDVDGDGAGPRLDCDPEDPSFHPRAPDPVGDGVDTNCDGLDGVDADGDGEASAGSGGLDCADNDPTTLGIDADTDGAPACVDCADHNALRRPGQPEACDGVDQDCDGVPDIRPDGLGVCLVSLNVADAVDLLVVVDNSCSMAEEQVELGLAAEALWNTYDAAGADVHVGVISTDMDNNEHQGKLRAYDGRRWVDSTTPDPVGTLQVMFALGTAGSSHETGRDAVFAAIELEGGSGGYNEGFYRDDAVLEVIVVSDESDYSNTNLPEFLTWFGELKVGGTPAVVNAVVVLDLATCPSGSTPGDAYTELVDATGGASASVCEPFAPALVDAVTTYLPGERDTFVIGADVEPTTLNVQVLGADGTVAANHGPNDVTWDEERLAVTLPVPPLPGSTVLFRFALKQTVGG